MACEGGKYRRRWHIRVFPHCSRRAVGGGGTKWFTVMACSGLHMPCVVCSRRAEIYLILLYIYIYSFTSFFVFIFYVYTKEHHLGSTKAHALQQEQIPTISSQRNTHLKNFNTSLLSLSLSLSLHTNKRVIVSWKINVLYGHFCNQNHFLN